MKNKGFFYWNVRCSCPPPPPDRPWQTAEEWFLQLSGNETSKFKLSKYKNCFVLDLSTTSCDIRHWNADLWLVGPSGRFHLMTKMTWHVGNLWNSRCTDGKICGIDRRWALNFHEIVWPWRDVLHHRTIGSHWNQVDKHSFTWSV